MSTTDLRSLQPLHDAIYDEEGRVVGSTEDKHEPMVEEEEEEFDFGLDYVDRSFLNGKNYQGDTKHKHLPRLVRYVGK